MNKNKKCLCACLSVAREILHTWRSVNLDKDKQKQSQNSDFSFSELIN